MARPSDAEIIKVLKYALRSLEDAACLPCIDEIPNLLVDRYEVERLLAKMGSK